jgi:putative nucleotidyltransferase with HDIG domain
MKKETYDLIETYMLSCMEDSAHDKEHIYRVLYNALEIAKGEEGVDYDVLITACLLHDIGRKEQFADPKVCHAAAGAEKAYHFLTDHYTLFAAAIKSRGPEIVRIILADHKLFFWLHLSVVLLDHPRKKSAGIRRSYISTLFCWYSRVRPEDGVVQICQVTLALDGFHEVEFFLNLIDKAPKQFRIAVGDNDLISEIPGFNQIVGRVTGIY